MSRASMMSSKANSMMGGGNSRGLKLLGLRVIDIISSLFPVSRDAAAAGSGQNGGKIVRSEFFGFWNQVSSPDCPDATVFLESLLDQLKLMIESKTPPLHTVSLDTLITTIAFMVLHAPFNVDFRPIRSFLQDWSTMNKDNLADNPSVRNIVRILSLRLEQDLDDMLGPLIIGGSTLHSLKEFQSLGTSSKQPTIDESDLQSNEYGFVYSYLNQLIQNGGVEVQLSVLVTLLNKTLTLPQHMKMNPLVAETTMLALLHMAKHILSVDAITNVAFLKRAIATIQPFFLWPQPHGLVARDLMEAFQAELLSPGWNRRELLLQESAVVDYATNNPDREPGYKYAKPVFYLYDSEDQAGLPLLNVLDASSFSSANIITPHPTAYDATGGLALPLPIQALCILHAINTDVECAETDRDALRALSPPQIASFFNRIQTLDQHVVNSMDQSRNDRSKELNKIRNEIVSIASTVDQGPALTTIPQTNPASHPFCPAMPAVEHVRVALNLKSKNNEHEKPGPTFPAAYVYAKLLDIMQGYSAECNVKNPVPREIRFVVAGNDALLQHVVTAYLALNKLKPELFHGLKLRFFIVPCARNNMANYIARHDSWYNRHLYSPFRSTSLFVPWLRDDESDLKPNSDPTPIHPTSYLRDCVTQYVREASCVLNASVFQLEGHYEARADCAPDEVIPFIQRVEIGIAPVLEEYRLRNRKPLGFKLDDAQKDKAFVSSAIDLSVRFTKLDLSGRRQPEVVDDPAPYASLIFSNVPRKADPAFPADPTTGGLEMHAQAYKPEKSKLKKNVLVLDPKQHIAEALIVSTTQTKFRVLVDGNIYGPYSYVKVAPVLDNELNHCKFPIQTFFPIDP